MGVPYLWRQVRRRGPLSLAIALMALVVGGLLCTLAGAKARTARQMEEVYDQVPVACAVTDLTGTQTDGLGLPEWAVNLFLSDTTTVGGKPLERAFSSFVTDVRAKLSLKTRIVCAEGGSSGEMPLTAVTGISADKALWAENGCTISWNEGCGEDMFQSEQPLCLLPADAAEAAETAEAGQITLCVSGEYVKPVERTFRVAGTYTGGSGDIYCSWPVGTELSLAVNGYLLADSLSADIRSNRELEQFWDSCAGLFFVRPDLEGTPVEWTASPVYTYFPYALLINDTVLRQTIAGLERNQMILNVLVRAILLMSLAGGALVSFLLVRGRERELALQCVLGMPRRTMFAGAFWEQFLLALAGTALAAGGYALLAGAPPAWRSLGLAIAADIIGIAAAMGGFLTRELTAALRGEH